MSLSSLEETGKVNFLKFAISSNRTSVPASFCSDLATSIVTLEKLINFAKILAMDGQLKIRNHFYSACI